MLMPPTGQDAATAWTAYEAAAKAYRDIAERDDASSFVRFEAAMAVWRTWSTWLDAMSLETCPRCAGRAAA